MEEEWRQKGATLSDKTARKQFGLTQAEIEGAIDAGQRKRCKRDSSCTRPVVHTSLNRPPRSTAWSWRGSPTSARRHPCRSARSTRRCREAVPMMPASSTRIVVPAAGADTGRAGDGRYGPTHGAVWRPCPSPRPSLAAGRGRPWPSARPEYGPVPRDQIVDGPFQHGGLAGAGRSHDETSRSAPATAAAASACKTSRPARIDRRRRRRILGLGVHGPRQHVLFLGEDRVARELRGHRVQPHRPAVAARRVTRPDGSRSTQPSITLSRARSRAAAHRCPAIEDTGGWR